jgi:Ca2+-binding EF-hand superfamily protein
LIWKASSSELDVSVEETCVMAHLRGLLLLSLHDLDQDGYLTIPELEAIYGLHHPHATKDTPEDHMESKRKIIIDKVLKQLDKNGDGKPSKH